MSFLNKIANLFGPKQENGITDADGLTLKKDIKVSELKIQFNERFGSVLRVYSGRSQVNNDITLSEAGLTNEGVFNCRGNMHVGNFINKMMEDYGLKVKVYTCDEWVAVLDGLTLSASGIVKKNAVKADMEAMLSGDDAKPEGVTHVSEAKIGAFAVIKNSDGSYSVTIDGMYCSNSKSAMRQIADALEFKYELEWTTRQFGAKLSDYMNKCASEMQMAPVSAPTVEKESVKAEKEAESVKTKTTVEKIKIDIFKPKVRAASNNAGTLSGVFTLEDGRKICFSQGPLQFNPVRFEFRFAENQYDIIGKDNEQIAPNYDGWIDLFGWGTSGYMGCQPTETSENVKEYGPSSGGIAGTKYDWGVYNPIINGGNKEGVWRTLTEEEWEYLVKQRPNSIKLVNPCTVNGRCGFMLLPDNFFDNRIPIPIDSTVNSCYTNTYTTEQWAQLEALGAVFFPAQGIRKLCSYEEGIAPSVWLASRVYGWRCGVAGNISGVNISFGRGVRLIRDLE